MTEADWTELRLALEQAALLTIEPLGVEHPFLHFHPVLIPYLRGDAPAQSEALMPQYAQYYLVASGWYYDKDDRHPLQVRATVQRELPNLRRAFGWLLESGDLELVIVMATGIRKFLTYFCLYQELQRMNQRVAEAFATRKPSAVETLTRAEYLHESNLGEEELRVGSLQAAQARFQRLLTRIESGPKDRYLDPGSYGHLFTLARLGQCLLNRGSSSEAMQVYRQAMELAETLFQHNPTDQSLRHRQTTLLANLGDTLLDQGYYAEAKQAHEQALRIAKELDDQGRQAISQGQLGTIAFEQQEYPEARRCHQQAMEIFHALGEPVMEAVAWRQLGMIARKEQNWPEAERCFRHGSNWANYT
jgi:tetratricopeptide (TPR) repeat protein